MVDSCLYILYASTTKTGPLWRGQGGVPPTGRNTGAQRCLISVFIFPIEKWPVTIFLTLRSRRTPNDPPIA